jgi:hypothetical protein
MVIWKGIVLTKYYELPERKITPMDDFKNYVNGYQEPKAFNLINTTSLVFLFSNKIIK